MQRRYVQCDVFSERALKGNGLAVVVEAEGVSDAQMQAFAIWTQQAETTFLLPPQAGGDYRVRIFSATGEMPFAGHPTLGSCAAWLHAGGVPQSPTQVIQECMIGQVVIDMSGGIPAFAAPPTDIAAMDRAVCNKICAALGIDASEVVSAVRLDNGVVRNLIALPTAQRVLSVDAHAVSKPAFDGVSVIGPHASSSDADFEIRNLTPASMALEDPVTGSLIAAAACWLKSKGELPDACVIAQGTAMGRAGRAYIRQHSDQILIGGHCAIVIDGHVSL